MLVILGLCWGSVKLGLVLNWGYILVILCCIGIILAFYWPYICVIFGLYWGYILILG